MNVLFLAAADSERYLHDIVGVRTSSLPSQNILTVLLKIYKTVLTNKIFAARFVYFLFFHSWILNYSTGITYFHDFYVLSYNEKGSLRIFVCPVYLEGFQRLFHSRDIKTANCK